MRGAFFVVACWLGAEAWRWLRGLRAAGCEEDNSARHVFYGVRDEQRKWEPPVGPWQRLPKQNQLRAHSLAAWRRALAEATARLASPSRLPHTSIHPRSRLPSPPVSPSSPRRPPHRSFRSHRAVQCHSIATDACACRQACSRPRHHTCRHWSTELCFGHISSSTDARKRAACRDSDMTRGGRSAPPPVGEHVATRVTLNHVLGNLGGRQKSWMNPDLLAGKSPVLASRPPRDAPRKPSQPRQPEEHADAEPSQAPTEGAAREHPASNSTSPQLANVLSHPPAVRPLPSPTAVLPSPSPSEDTNLDYHAPVSYARPRARQSTADEEQAASLSRDEACLEGPRQEVAAPKRPAAGTSPTLANKRARPSTAAPPLRTSSVHIDQQGMDRRVSAGQLQSEITKVRQPNSPGFTPSSNNLSPRRPQQQALPQQYPAPQRVTSQAHSNVQKGPTPPAQGTRQLLLPSNNWATRDDPTVPTQLRVHILQELARFHSMDYVTADSPDRKRLTALEQAAKQMDWDYLITHLFYCLLSLNKTALPDIIRKCKHADRTEEFLSEVLNRNHILNPATQAFFTRFPISLHEWARLNPSQSQTDIDNFVDLMNRSGRYFELKNQCDERDLPPSMHELADDLGIRSRQLQTIVFTAAVRRLWFKQGLPPGDILNQYEHEALRCFSATQETFYRRRGQVHDLQHERQLEMRYWINSFRGLRESHIPAAQHALQAFHATLHPPVLASHRLASIPLQPRQPQRTLSGHNHQPPLVQPRVYPDPRFSPHSAQATLLLGRGQPQGRPRLATQQPRPQLQRQSHRFLLPPAGHHEPQQHMPNPARFALHQAHLRSPTLRSKTRERLYLYVQDFLGNPQRLVDARNRVEKWTFTLSPEQMATIPKNDAGEAGGLPVRVIDEKSSLLRLRCVKWNSAQDFNTHRWATSDTSWIPYSFFQLNSKPLEQRKKLYYGRDLPIDLTSLVKQGENVLEMSLLRAPENRQFRNYLIAIEVLGVRSHDALVEDILKKQHVPAVTTKQRIRDKLTGTADEEIAVVNSTLNITLFDPFSLSEICRVPVRSRTCDHFDCFDLETFLSTRKRNVDVTVPDIWKCPICNGDARPHLLVVDGFMQEVRSELEQQGLLTTRAIIVNEDGSWKPKPEVREGVADHDDDDAPAYLNGQNFRGSQNPPVPQTVEVIDLGDSDAD